MSRSECRVRGFSTHAFIRNVCEDDDTGSFQAWETLVVGRISHISQQFTSKRNCRWGQRSSLFLSVNSGWPLDIVKSQSHMSRHSFCFPSCGSLLSLLKPTIFLSPFEEKLEHSLYDHGAIISSLHVDIWKCEICLQTCIQVNIQYTHLWYLPARLDVLQTEDMSLWAVVDNPLWHFPLSKDLNRYLL